MNKGLLFLIGILMLTACSAQKNLIGNYSRTEKDFKYDLQLSAGNTFSLTQKYFEVVSKCSGKWTQLSTDTLLLKCNDATDVAETLLRGYMSEREKKVIVLNRNKLRLGQVILKRKN
jgi:hypothetical protein